MHGLIFNQMFRFIEETRGEQKLQKILNDSGVASKFYSPTQFYPDEELNRIIQSTCKILKLRRNDFLESFGMFMGPGLLRIYQAFIPEEWDLMDLLENIETTVHQAVRLNDSQAAPPTLNIERNGPDDISITYSSERNMINLGIGIIKALAMIYKTHLEIRKMPMEKGTVLKIKRLKKRTPFLV